MGEATACVNGCRSTRTLDDGSRQRVPRLASAGHVCQQCRDRLDEWLETIPDAYGRLIDVAEPGSVQAEPDAKRGRNALVAPVPVRVDVLDLVDARLGWRSDGTADRRGVLGLIEAWGRLVREERRMRIPRAPATVAGECSFLRRQVDWLCGRPWVDELYGEIRTLARELSAAIGEPWSGPIGECPDCDAPLWMPPEGADRIDCRSCGASWERRHWLRLADVIEYEADHAAGGAAAGDQQGRRVEAR